MGFPDWSELGFLVQYGCSYSWNTPGVRLILSLAVTDLL